MAKPKKSTYGPKQRAYFLRRKRDSGKSLGTDEIEWLEQYEGKISGVAPDPASPPSEPIEPTVDDLPAPDPLPSPPRAVVEVDDEDEKPTKRGGDWRDKYKAVAAGDGGNSVDGRQQVCEFVAGQWLEILKALCDGMPDAGITPWIDPVALGPAIVLTLDQVLPKEVKLTPPMIAVGGSSALIIQRWVKNKPIKEALSKRTDEGKHKAKLDELKRRTEESEAAHKVREQELRQSRETQAKPMTEAEQAKTVVLPPLQVVKPDADEDEIDPRDPSVVI